MMTHRWYQDWSSSNAWKPRSHPLIRWQSCHQYHEQKKQLRLQSGFHTNVTIRTTNRLRNPRSTITFAVEDVVVLTMKGKQWQERTAQCSISHVETVAAKDTEQFVKYSQHQKTNHHLGLTSSTTSACFNHIDQNNHTGSLQSLCVLAETHQRFGKIVYLPINLAEVSAVTDSGCKTVGPPPT